MIAARMLTRFIWNAETTVKNAARRVSPFCFSSTLGGRAGKVWKCSGRFTSLTAFHRGSQVGCHIGSMSQEHDSSLPRSPSLGTPATPPARRPELAHPVALLHRRVDVAVGQAGQADEAVGVVPAEVYQPVVVDVEHLGGGLVIVQPRGRAEDAVDALGLHPVAVHVLRPQLGSGRPGDALAAVGLESG